MAELRGSVAGKQAGVHEVEVESAGHPAQLRRRARRDGLLAAVRDRPLVVAAIVVAAGLWAPGLLAAGAPEQAANASGASAAVASNVLRRSDIGFPFGIVRQGEASRQVCRAHRTRCGASDRCSTSRLVPLDSMPKWRNRQTRRT